MNNEHPQPGQWCWFWIYNYNKRKLKIFKKISEDTSLPYIDVDGQMWKNCQPLTEQELIDNGLKEKEQMQEQISEELCISIFKVIGIDEQFIKEEIGNVKKAGLIKESALDKARKIMSGVEKTESNFFARHIVLELSRLYESAIAQIIKVMLDALIEIKELCSHPDYKPDVKAIIKICESSIEKATGKTWKEISG